MYYVPTVQRYSSITNCNRYAGRGIVATIGQEGQEVRGRIPPTSPARSHSAEVNNLMHEPAKSLMNGKLDVPTLHLIDRHCLDVR